MANTKERRTKARYRITNWPDYNKALVRRGSVTIWLSRDVLRAWWCDEPSGRRGAPRVYSGLVIECALTLQAVYDLPLRATQGLMRSVLDLLRCDLPEPCYTTLCRRRRSLELRWRPLRSRRTPLHVVIDSSGLKVYGEGEWKVRLHGWSKRRTWLKVHLGVDEASGEVVAAMATTPNVGDKEVVGDLLEQIERPVVAAGADGAYDYQTVYAALEDLGARALIPPRENAREWNNGQMDARDEAVRRIREVGRAQWKREVGYHRRSLAENAFFRLKTLFGEHVSARGFDAQANEVTIRLLAMNRMTALGMPLSIPM